jgi:putative transposase
MVQTPASSPAHAGQYAPTGGDGVASLARILLSLKLRMAQRVIARWRELSAPILASIMHDGAPRFWQKCGGFDRNARDEAEVMREIRYIHWNPVRRGVVDRPAAFPFSSVRWWMGERDCVIQCDWPPAGGWETWKGFV